MDVNLRELNGVWNYGLALDKHTLRSVYTGDNEWGRPTFDTERSEAGEALFQLKYRDDFTQVGPLADAIIQHIIPLMGEFHFIVSMPPSKTRQKQPVEELARAISDKTGITYLNEFLYKTQATPQLKDMESRDEKVEILLDALEIDTSRIPKLGSYNILIVDDLFDSGTSLEAATLTARKCGNIGQIFVATATWK